MAELINFKKISIDTFLGEYPKLMNNNFEYINNYLSQYITQDTSSYISLGHVNNLDINRMTSIDISTNTIWADKYFNVDYDNLNNIPTINGVEVIGELDNNALGLSSVKENGVYPDMTVGTSQKSIGKLLIFLNDTSIVYDGSVDVSVNITQSLISRVEELENKIKLLEKNIQG